jgi:hemin uptake protein HemP
MTLALPHPPRRSTLSLAAQAPAPRAVAALPVSAVPVHDARALTGEQGLARIRLDGQEYTLRITRAGKLILTK